MDTIKRNWTATSFMPPPIGVFVHTKISDKSGERNFQKMKFENNLWFCIDGTYVYYRPTHWAYVEKVPKDSNHYEDWQWDYQYIRGKKIKP